MGTPEPTPNEHHRFTRSGLLKRGGALIVVIGIPTAVWRIAGTGSDAPTTWPTALDPSTLDSWLAIHADGTVTAFTGKTDLGQGNRTALSQIVAEELDVPFDRVQMVMGDTDTCVDQGPTVATHLNLAPGWRLDGSYGLMATERGYTDDDADARRHDMRHHVKLQSDWAISSSTGAEWHLYADYDFEQTFTDAPIAMPAIHVGSVNFALNF